MLSLFKSKPQPAMQPEPVGPIETTGAVRRMKQQNIKASEDVCTAFAAIAEAQGMTKADLFEDLVAERLELLRQQGLNVSIE